MLLGRSRGLGRKVGDAFMLVDDDRTGALRLGNSAPFASCLTSALDVEVAVDVPFSAGAAGCMVLDVTIGDMPAFLLMMALSRLLDDDRPSGLRTASSAPANACSDGTDCDGDMDEAEARGDDNRTALRRPNGELRPENAATVRGEDEDCAGEAEAAAPMEATRR